MKISEVIAKLEEIKTQHGDIRVTHLDCNYEVDDVEPLLAWMRVNNKREKRREYWKSWYKPDSAGYREKGEKIVKV